MNCTKVHDLSHSEEDWAVSELKNTSTLDISNLPVISGEPQLMEKESEYKDNSNFKDWKRCIDPSCRAEQYKATLIFLGILFKQSRFSRKLKRK